MLDNILEKMTMEILLRMTSLIRHFEYYHIWQKIGNAVYFDNIKYLLLQIFRDDTLARLNFAEIYFRGINFRVVLFSRMTN